MKTGFWGGLVGAFALSFGAASCGGGDDEDGGKDFSPSEACATLYELCTEFPVPEEECVSGAESGAPQSDLNCVGNSEDCYEAVECLGYTREQYDAAVAAAQMNMGGAEN